MKDTPSTDTERNAPSTADETLLICPPFQSPTLSSIAIARLADHLRRRRLPCEDAYLHLDFCRLIGMERYLEINDTTDGRGNGLTAELLFAEGLHGAIDSPPLEAVLDRLLGDREARTALRQRFAAQVRARLGAPALRLVGITTSFNQLLAALWITRIVKQARPDVTVVLGGSACARPMGNAIARAYPEVDYVVEGYGESPLLTLASGERPAGRVLIGDPAPDPNTLPIPEYRPFQRTLADFDPTLTPSLVFQSSRGCWWGEKRHCTFCGLDAGHAAFRAKSRDRALEEIRTLWERHGANLVATDCILAKDHLRELLPRLARFQEKPQVFYEMKANLRESDVIAMARANITGQLGIESLSSRLLRLMNKGLTAIRALAVLKWCREQRVNVVWNQLCGVPGETAEDYDKQIALMKRIPHFKPPHRVNPVVIDRFSPYFENYRAYGYTALMPIPQTAAAHPGLKGDALREITYHFEGEGAVTPDAYRAGFAAAVADWKARHERGDGLYWRRFEGLTRVTEGAGERVPMTDIAGRIIEATHRIVPRDRVIDTVGCAPGLIDEMVDAGLLYQEKKNLVNLTVRVTGAAGEISKLLSGTPPTPSGAAPH